MTPPAERRRNACSQTIVKAIPFTVIALSSFAVYLLLNIDTPAFGDDIAIIFQDLNPDPAVFEPHRITSIGEMLTTLLDYYLHYRGRFVAEGLEIFFAVRGKQYFNPLNALVFTGISWLVYYHANFGKKSDWRLFLAVCASFWFLTPNLTNTYLWMVCALNSVWPVFFILLFLVPYRFLLAGRTVGRPKLAAALIIPAGFLAGTFNEQSFGLSLGFVVLTLVAVRLRRSRPPRWSLAGLAGVIGGMLLLFLSPGYRISTAEGYGGSPLALLFKQLLFRLEGAVMVTWRVSWALLLGAVVVFVLLMSVIRASRRDQPTLSKKNARTPSPLSLQALLDDNDGLLSPFIFLLTAVASVAVMLGLPYFEYRLFFTVFTAFALLFFSLLAELAARVARSNGKARAFFSRKLVAAAVPLLLAAATVTDFSLEYRVYHQHSAVHAAVVADIEKRVSAGEKDILVRNVTQIPQQLLPERRLRSIVVNWTVTGLTEDASQQINRFYAVYFGAETIRGERKAGDPPVSPKDGIVARYHY